MATFGTLVTRLQDHFSTGSGAAARHLRQLNEWHRRILNLSGCERFRRSTLDLSIAAGDTSTELPATFTRIEHLVNVTSNLPLTEQSLSWYRSIPPNTYATGSPFAYVIYGTAPVATQPIAAGAAIYVKSASAADTTQSLYLRVRRLTGQEATATVALNGVTAVQASTWTDVTEILQAFLSAACAGNVLIADTALGTIPYGYIYPPDLNSNRMVVLLVPTPASAITLRVDGIRAMDTDLLTTDQPWIGEEWDFLLELGARTLEYEKQDDDRYARVRTEFEAELKRFKFKENIRPDQIMVPGSGRIETASNLGPHFPAGRW